MSLNRTLRDFIVKKIAIKKKVGNTWTIAHGPPVVGTKYRLEVYAGNKDGRISWGTEGDYNKVLLKIRVVPVGFLNVPGMYIGKTKIKFYTNSAFSQAISGSLKYRTSFTLPEYKPTHADSLTYLYLKFLPNVPNRPLGLLRWSVGIYGAVRNHHWKSRFTSLS